jgi:hypothetical protein
MVVIDSIMLTCRGAACDGVADSVLFQQQKWVDPLSDQPIGLGTHRRLTTEEPE